MSHRNDLEYEKCAWDTQAHLSSSAISSGRDCELSTNFAIREFGGMNVQIIFTRLQFCNLSVGNVAAPLHNARRHIDNWRCFFSYACWPMNMSRCCIT